MERKGVAGRKWEEWVMRCAVDKSPHKPQHRCHRCKREVELGVGGAAAVSGRTSQNARCGGLQWLKHGTA